MTAEPDFREWADERYGWPGVSEILLECQDGLGLNVNILLWCAWCAEYFGEIPELPLRKAMDVTGAWSRDVTGALRTVRRTLKRPPREADAEAANALRQEVLAAELKAEYVEQAMLAALARSTLVPFADSKGALLRARRNITRYAALGGAVRKPRFSTLLLDDLATRIFPYADHTERLKA